MSEISFPIKDLWRRKLQTSLALISLITYIAATVFLLLFAEQLGFGINSAAENALTVGYSTIFSSFLLFVGILVFAVGAVIVSFIAFLLMAQRTRDFGLIKAAGCPNGLVFSYFFTELLIVLFVGCFLGVALGFLTDYAVINLGAFQAYPKALNLWYAPLVFVAFLVFGLVFGLKPLLNASRLSPIVALSPVQYFGVTAGSRFKALSKSKLTLNIAARSLFRRQSATVRIFFFLSIVFILLTVSITGSIIANDTTTARVEEAGGKDLLLVAHPDMGNQYIALLSKFSGGNETTNFNYLDPNLAIPEAALHQLNGVSGIANFETRLICKGHMQELMNFTIDPDTQATNPIGDNRETDALIVGVDSEKVLSSWFIEGRFLRGDNSSEAVVGDSVAAVMFEKPLSQSFVMQNTTFNVVGLCLDPINNGFVTFVSLEKLENLNRVSSPNVVFVQLDSSFDYASVVAQMQSHLASVNSDLKVFELTATLKKNISFLGAIWSIVMFLPFFTLVAATLCLMAYLVLAIDEQHHEFAVLRALGAKPKTVVTVLAVQSLIVLFSSFAVGISLGVIITLMILIPQPVATSFAILSIAAWLLTALAGMFMLSLYPAVRFARKPVLKVMS
jgi:ABC-type antimicrobial peptide transport system permease subunit